MQPEQVEARLDARLEVLLETRAAMHKAAEGGHDSEVAHVDNHPADTGSELHDEELDETTDIFMDEERRRSAPHQAEVDRCVDRGVAHRVAVLSRGVTKMVARSASRLSRT